MRLEELAARLGCELRGDGKVEIERVATLDDAAAGDLTFLSNPRYASKAATTKASAIILGLDHAGDVTIPSLRARDPYQAFAKALAIFYRPPVPTPGIHPTAIIDPSAQIGPNASVGPYAVVEARTRIGAGAVLAAHAFVGADCVIGDDFVAHAGSVVRERVTIGSRVILQNGAVVGGDGFGYTMGEAGIPLKLPQAGTVVLEDNVEIGANATVDRATIGATRIRRGAKIDNLVQIAHGCDVGEGCFLAAQTGLAGSTRLGRYVQLGGQVGMAGHLEIGDFVRVAAKSGVPNDVAANATIGGIPAVEIGLWRRLHAIMPRLPELLRRVRRLEKALKITDS